jgi:heme/copper-type cytochrome/quinol oxidase subunit 1
MPRRIPDYPDAFEGWNYVSSIGSLISVVATVIFLYVVYDMIRTPQRAIGNAWATYPYFTDTTRALDNAQQNSTLDWVVPAPTPLHAFSMVPCSML